MGRELRRKQERQNKKIVKQEELDTTIHGITILKVVFAVILILLVLYYILAVFVTKEIDVTGKKNDDAANTNTAEGVTNKILASATFRQSEESYFVYYYDFSDEDESIKSALESRSDLKVYRVDTSSSLNSKYVTDGDTNLNVSTIDDLRVKNPTLLEITNDQVVHAYEGANRILEILNQ